MLIGRIRHLAQFLLTSSIWTKTNAERRAQAIEKKHKRFLLSEKRRRTTHTSKNLSKKPVKSASFFLSILVILSFFFLLYNVPCMVYCFVVWCLP